MGPVGLGDALRAIDQRRMVWPFFRALRNAVFPGVMGVSWYIWLGVSHWVWATSAGLGVSGIWDSSLNDHQVRQRRRLGWVQA